MHRAPGEQLTQRAAADAAAELPNLLPAFRNALQQRLQFTGARVFAWEEKLLRESGTNNIGAAGRDLEVCYPALAALWRRQIAHWQNATREFLLHAAAFGCVTDVVPDLSDCHCGGRTVIRATFGTAATWFYKPRSGSHEAAWFALLQWVNGEGFPLPFRILRVVENGDHCWMESVQQTRCRTTACGQRAGAILYLAHLLRAVDLHRENVVVAGEQPVLVDCETFLHPQLRIPEPFRSREQGFGRTGLLPPRGTSCADSIAAFAAADLPQLAAGVLQMHAFLKQLGENRFHDAVAQLFPRTCRIVPRPTAFYHHLVRESLSPNLLVTAQERQHFLRTALEAGATRQRDVSKELAALTDAEIPRLLARSAAPRRLPTDAQLHKSAAAIRELRA